MYQNVQTRPFSLAQFKKISYLCIAIRKNNNNIQFIYSLTPLNTLTTLMSNTNKGTLKYKKYQFTNNGGENNGKTLWYARAIQDRTLEFEELVNHVSNHNSPYSRGVIQGVLTDTLDCLKELLLDGKSVRLADLGLLSVGISSKGAPTREAWNTSYITGVKLVVRNTKSWSNAELRKECRLSEISGYTEASPSDNPSGDGNDDNPGGSGTTDPSTRYFTLTTLASPAAGGTVTGGGSYAEGKSVRLTAEAADGYRFTGWSDGEKSSVRTVDVTADKTYTARFEETGETGI